MSNHTVQAAAEGMPVFKSSSAALEALALASDDEQPNLVEAFVGMPSKPEVQAVGAQIDALADRKSLVDLLDGMSPEARGELLAFANDLADGEGAPKFLTLRASQIGLRNMSIAEVGKLSDALRTLRDVTSGLCCQPRFQGEQNGSYNAPGDMVDTVSEFFSHCLTHLREEMDRRIPNGPKEAKERAEHILLDEVLLGDDFGELAKVCASLGLSAAISAEAASTPSDLAFGLLGTTAARMKCEEVEAPTAESAADPCLAFIENWNRDPDNYESFQKAAGRGDIPPPTTAAGAAAALRQIIDLDDSEPMDMHLVSAALLYLDGVAAPAAASTAEPTGASLVAAIERHRAALASQEEAAEIGDKRWNAKQARPSDAEVVDASNEAELNYDAAFESEQDTHNALIAFPVSSLGDMRAKAAYLASVSRHMIHDNDTMKALLASMIDGDGGIAPQPVEPDPLVALIATYREQIAFYNAAPTHVGTDEDDVLAATTWRPPYDLLCTNPPVATTMDGVRAALRFVFDEEERNGGQPALTCSILRAALAYLDGRA